MNYQLLPEMTEEQYTALKADIADRGVMIPLEYDEAGNLLDGHHRLKACMELGITDFPRITRHFKTEEEKCYHIQAINAVRRHLTQEQMRQVISKQLQYAPHKSDRQIATDLGVSNSTVSLLRKEMEKNNELCESHSSIGADGKERPRQVERKPIELPVIIDEPNEEYQINIDDFEDEEEPFNPKIIDLPAMRQQKENAEDEIYNLGWKMHGILTKIVDNADKFDPTDENIDALLGCYDDFMTLEEQIEYINDTIEKLQTIKMKLSRGRKYAKRKN